jgi:hypothetical protein
MASKFDKLFQNAEAEPPAAPEIATRHHTESQAPSVRPIGRPPGKRSDPAWKQFSVLLKRDTQREAAAILRRKDEGRGGGLDLSGLVQSLLESWIERQEAEIADRRPGRPQTRS